jgi:hypothetical protein
MYIWRDSDVQHAWVGHSEAGEVWERLKQKAIGCMQRRGYREMDTLHLITTRVPFTLFCSYVTNFLNYAFLMTHKPTLSWRLNQKGSGRTEKDHVWGNKKVLFGNFKSSREGIIKIILTRGAASVGPYYAEFIHILVCSVTGPQPLPKWVLHQIQSSVSTLNFFLFT